MYYIDAALQIIYNYVKLIPQNMGQRRIYSVLLADWPFLKDRRVEEERGVKKYGSSLFSRISVSLRMTLVKRRSECHLSETRERN